VGDINNNILKIIMMVTTIKPGDKEKGITVKDCRLN